MGASWLRQAGLFNVGNQPPSHITPSLSQCQCKYKNFNKKGLFIRPLISTVACFRYLLCVQWLLAVFSGLAFFSAARRQFLKFLVEIDIHLEKLRLLSSCTKTKFEACFPADCGHLTSWEFDTLVRAVRSIISCL